MAVDSHYSNSASAGNPEQKGTFDDAVGLTARQRDLLVFIRAYQHRYGIAPSFQDMMEHMGLASKSGIHRLVHALAQRGHIRFDKARARSIIVRKPSGPTVADAIAILLAEVSLSDRTQSELRALLVAE